MRTDRPWQIASMFPPDDPERRDVYNLAFDRDGNVWVARSDGLFFFDGYAWRRFGRESGLPSDFVRSVCMTRDGTLWVGTDQGAGTFDGTRFETHGSADGLAGPSVRRIVEAPDGTIWFCSDRWPKGDVQAGLASFAHERWRQYRSEDGLPSDHVHDFFVDSRGRRFVMTLRGIAQMHGERWGPPEIPGFPADTYARDMVETPAGELVVSTRTDVWITAGDRWKATGFVGGKLLVTRDGTLIAAESETDRRAVRVVRRDGDRWVPASAWAELHGWNVEDLREAADGTIWGAGKGMLFRWERNGAGWTEFEGLPSPAFCDSRDQVWFVGARGTRVLRGEAFLDGPRLERGILGEADGAVWSVVSGKLAEVGIDSLAVERIHDLDSDGVANLVVDGARKVWIRYAEGGEEQILAYSGNGNWTPVSVSAIAGHGLVYFSPHSAGGVLVVVENAGQRRSVHHVTDPGNATQIPVPEEITLVNKAYSDVFGVWILPLRGLLFRPAGEIGPAAPVPAFADQSFFSIRSTGRQSWFFFDERPPEGSEVASFDGSHWRLFDFRLGTHHLASPEIGVVMTGQDGLYVQRPENEAVRFVLSPAGASFSALVPRKDGEIWVEQAGAVLRYRPDRDPPRAAIQLGAPRVPQGDDVLVRFVGIDRFRPGRDQRTFSFSWSLDGGAWTEWSASAASLPRLGDLRSGRHEIRLRAMNSSGVVSSQVAAASVMVMPPPLQLRPWFLPVVTLALAGVLALAFYAFRRASQLAEAKHALEAEVLEHRRTEAAMRAATRELESFSYSVSHDLHAPLRAIAGFTAAIDEECGDRFDEAGRAYLGRIKAASIRMGGLIDALLSLFRLTRREMVRTEVDLTAMAREILDKLHAAEPDRKCELFVGPDLVAHADRQMLVLVMENLLGNAWKYSARAELTRIEVGMTETDQGPTFFVRDSGAGFDRSATIDPFAPFQRLHRDDEFEGLGIGLANVQRVINRHGGKVWAESQRGKGATFFFTLGD